MYIDEFDRQVAGLAAIDVQLKELALQESQLAKISSDAAENEGLISCPVQSPQPQWPERR